MKTANVDRVKLKVVPSKRYTVMTGMQLAEDQRKQLWKEQ